MKKKVEKKFEKRELKKEDFLISGFFLQASFEYAREDMEFSISRVSTSGA